MLYGISRVMAHNITRVICYAAGRRVPQRVMLCICYETITRVIIRDMIRVMVRDFGANNGVKMMVGSNLGIFGTLILRSILLPHPIL